MSSSNQSSVGMVCGKEIHQSNTWNPWSTEIWIKLYTRIKLYTISSYTPETDPSMLLPSNQMASDPDMCLMLPRRATCSCSSQICQLSQKLQGGLFCKEIDCSAKCQSTASPWAPSREKSKSLEDIIKSFFSQQQSLLVWVSDWLLKFSNSFCHGSLRKKKRNILECSHTISCCVD